MQVISCSSSSCSLCLRHSLLGAGAGAAAGLGGGLFCTGGLLAGDLGGAGDGDGLVGCFAGDLCEFSFAGDLGGVALLGDLLPVCVPFCVWCPPLAGGFPPFGFGCGFGFPPGVGLGAWGDVAGECGAGFVPGFGLAGDAGGLWLPFCPGEFFGGPWEDVGFLGGLFLGPGFFFLEAGGLCGGDAPGPFLFPEVPAAALPCFELLSLLDVALLLPLELFPLPPLEEVFRRRKERRRALWNGLPSPSKGVMSLLSSRDKTV